MSHWQLFGASSANATLHPSELAVPSVVATHQSAMPVVSGVAVFAADGVAGLATRDASVAVGPGSPIGLDIVRPARGAGVLALTAAGTTLAVWTHDPARLVELRDVGRTLARHLGSTFSEQDCGVDV